jgi:GAF domain-containing protein
MKKPDELERTYVRKVREGTQKYARDLMAENDRLRMLIAALESDRVRLAERARSVESVLQEVDLLRGAVSVLEREKLGVQTQLFAACEELESHRQERARLEQQVAEVEKESRRFAEQYVQVEAQNTNLANLYVASYRLYGTLDRREVLGAIEEIVVNLIGSEELGVYELEPGEGTLRLVASFGIDPTVHDRIPVGEGRIGRVAATGEADIGDGGTTEARAQETDLTACVPLKLDGRVVGALALFRLLPQKNGFESLDHELFGLLGTHAATALYCTRLQERLEARTPA